MDFHEGSVDLVKTYDRFKQLHGPSSVSWKPFALPIVRLANDTLGGLGANPGELPGIRRCLVQLTFQLRWRDYLWFFPLPFENRLFFPGPYGGYGPDDHKSARLLVDSLMLTVTEYREALRSFHTNLAPLIFVDILEGFQWLCDWIHRGVPISPPKNPCIAAIDVARLKTVLHVSLALPNVD